GEDNSIQRKADINVCLNSRCPTIGYFFYATPYWPKIGTFWIMCILHWKRLPMGEFTIISGEVLPVIRSMESGTFHILRRCCTTMHNSSAFIAKPINNDLTPCTNRLSKRPLLGHSGKCWPGMVVSTPHWMPTVKG